MVSPRVLKRRIRSVQNTAKITKAMEMIATAKMKRSQDQAIAGRPYDSKISQIISHLAAESVSQGSLHPLLEKRSSIKQVAIIHITSNRGLCGGLNTNVNRLTSDFIFNQKSPVTLVTVGKKGYEFMKRVKVDITAEFSKIHDRPAMVETLPISRIIIDSYSQHLLDMVYISYTKFVSTMVQKPVIEQLLPVEPAKIEKTETKEYIFEPTNISVLEGLLPRYVDMKVYHAILEATASEHSARMVAMRSASDNANQLIQYLTLMLNKSRQEMITTELLDITGGAEILQ
jgi:F-type H+-transporting ATPase subunit gamma